MGKTFTFIALVASSTFISSSALAGRITTNPLSSLGDEVVSTSLKQSKNNSFNVLAKTTLETFSIEVKSYADASALAADLKKDSLIHCKMAKSLRVDRVSSCKLVEVKFND